MNGVGTGNPETLVGLYRAIGKLSSVQGMRLGMWSSRWDLMRAGHPALKPVMHTEMGGIKVTFATAELPSV